MYSSYSQQQTTHNNASALPESRTFGFLGAGAHSSCTITEAKLVNGQFVQIKFTSLCGYVHNERFFVYDRNGNKWGKKLTEFLAEVVPDFQCYQTISTTDINVWKDYLINCKVDLILTQKNGFDIKVLDKKYLAVDVKTNETVVLPSTSINKVLQEARKRGLQRAYADINKVVAESYLTDNIEVFKNAAYSSQKTLQLITTSNHKVNE